MSDIIIVEETGDTVVVQEYGAVDTVTLVTEGPQGPEGPTGPAGLGVPVGGTTGQVLAKTSATNYATAWVSTATGSVTSVAATVPTGLTVTGSPITTSGTLAIAYASGYSIPTTANQTNWTTAYTDRLKWDGGATGLVAATGRTSLGLGTIATQNASAVAITGGSVTGITDLAIGDGGTGASTAATARTNLGATTVGGNLFTLANPSAVTFPRFNADNTISALDAATFRTAIGAGTSSTTGTVTSVGGTGTVSGISLSGTVTSSGNLTLGGTLDLSSPPAIGGTAPNTVNGTVLNATNGIVVNSNTVAASYTIPSGSSAMSAGPMTVASGQTVTVSSGSRWVIL